MTQKVKSTVKNILQTDKKEKIAATKLIYTVYYTEKENKPVSTYTFRTSTKALKEAILVHKAVG